jgi:hypothetical protein
MPDVDDDLIDAAMTDEIELIADVVAAAAEFDGPLDQADVDRALGVSEHPVEDTAFTTLPSGGNAVGDS